MGKPQDRAAVVLGRSSTAPKAWDGAVLSSNTHEQTTEIFSKIKSDCYRLFDQFNQNCPLIPGFLIQSTILDKPYCHKTIRLS